MQQTQIAPKFTLDDAQRAGDEWGFNCGPAAVAAICGLSIDELRPHLGDFEKRGHTTPTLMRAILREIGVEHVVHTPPAFPFEAALEWPSFGLARIQWEGPWTSPGVPIRARYRHTHWVSAISDDGWVLGVPGSSEPDIFDVNCLCVGGWVPLSEWTASVVPWLLGEVEPKANGHWHITHSVEIQRRK